MENIKLLEKNNTLLYYFHELTMGKYDDGELSNFFIKSNDTTKEEYFILSESNDEESTVNFIKDNLMSNKISDKNINYDTNNFNMLVLLVNKSNNKLDIKTLGIMEWLASKIMLDDSVTSFTDIIQTLNKKEYNLYVSNSEDIKENFKEILANDNFHEIISSEIK